MEISIKSTGNAFSPIQLNFLRFLAGGILLLPLAIRQTKKNNTKFHQKDFWTLAITGFLMVVISMTFYQLAIQNGEASMVAVVYSANPIFSLIFAFLLLHEKPSKTKLISTAISLIGLLVIVNPAKLTNIFGLSLAVISALTFGLYSIMSKFGSKITGMNGIEMTSYTFLTGSVELLILILISKIPAISNIFASNSILKIFSNIPVTTNVNMHYLLILLFIGFGVTGGGFAFYFLAMENVGVSTASLVFFIKPALAPILSFFILGEGISTNTYIGIVIIIISSLINIGSQYKENKKSSNHINNSSTQIKN